MTYNFDPERWYENERAVIESSYRSGEMDQQAYEKAIQELDQRYDEMLDRLNGTYQI